jgi:NAD(P)-dependent dehydrogenase (short-subunit alcohol dehydrogenase family)
MEPLISLEDKNILITGASSGIGRACAILCSKLGANVILVARNEDRLHETYSSLRKGEHLLFSQDITEHDKIEDIIKVSVEKLGKISGFVHSAGIQMTLPIKNMKPSDYERLFSVNVISGFEVARILCKKKYRDKLGSSFVFISSVMGILGQSGKVGYCSSKSALNSGIKAMALELISKNIRVNCILPAIVETDMVKKMFSEIPEDAKKMITDMHPLGLGNPEDVSNACAFLLSGAARWITGTNLIVDGGYSAC